MYSVCDNSECLNYKKVASNPRSKTPLVCGKCGQEVRIFSAESKRGEENDV